MAPNGLGESNNETQKVLTGIRFMEAFDIVGGMDFLRWGLELERWGNDWNPLGMRSRGQHDGLSGIVVGWEING